jgi:hypothetical protein
MRRDTLKAFRLAMPEVVEAVVEKAKLGDPEAAELVLMACGLLDSSRADEKRS